MPTYIVRWPNLSAALVRADSEAELIDILDEVANPDGCTWTEYDGPLFLDFELSAHAKVERADDDEKQDRGMRLLNPEDIRIEGAEALAAHSVSLMNVSIAGETGYEMEQAIAEFAFPAMSAVYWGDSDGIDAEALERALRDDAMRLVEYSWRRSHVQRSNDPDARLALQMDASLRWIKQQRERAEAEEDDDGDEIKADESSAEEEIADLLDTAWVEWEEKRSPAGLREVLAEMVALLDVMDDAVTRD